MPEPIVYHSDLELFLTGWMRAALAARPEGFAAGWEVDSKEPADDPFPAKLIVIRDLGGPSTWFMTGERSVGISILAGVKENPFVARDMSRLVVALLPQIPSTSAANPVTAVLGTNGPFPVPESQPHARMYLTADFAVVASATFTSTP